MMTDLQAAQARISALQREVHQMSIAVSALQLRLPTADVGPYKAVMLALAELQTLDAIKARGGEEIERLRSDEQLQLPLVGDASAVRDRRLVLLAAAAEELSQKGHPSDYRKERMEVIRKWAT